MLGRWRSWVYEWAFYLPSVHGELSRFESHSERNRARLHVYRHLFRSWRYWLLCLASVVSMLLAMAAPLILSPSVRAAFGQTTATVERLGIFVYFIGLALLFTVVGMLPLKRMILRQLRVHMNDQGISVCVECGYDLRGGASDRCPECGHSHASQI